MTAEPPAPPARRGDRPPADSRDAAAPTKPPRWKVWRKRLVVAAAVLTAVGAGLFFGRHMIYRALDTESTDDAYVNGHVSSVSGRVSGSVVAIYVDDNDRVRQGQLLLEMDHEPYQVTVDQRRAALRTAESNRSSAVAQARSQEAKARSSWYSMVKAQEQVRAQVATVRSDVAKLRLREAQYKLAEVEVDRVKRLVAKDAASKEELDQKAADLEVNRQQVADAAETIRKDRAALGLAPDDAHPTDVPADLEQTNSGVQTSLSDTAMALAQIGVPVRLDALTPDGLRKTMEQLDSGGGKERAIAWAVDQAPPVQQATGSVAQAREDLRNAELNLRYTYLYAPIDGQVVRRAVNPGDNVMAGQGLMAVRSLTDVWVDANFKETQLHKMAIGHPVELAIDAYPGKVFRGRVEGFSAGTGQSLSVLPAENATGNFVKIVQRLPVRIRVNPDDITPDTPLLVGLSVVPVVKYKDPAEGPDAGRRLLDPGPRREPSRTVVPPLPLVPPVPAGKP